MLVSWVLNTVEPSLRSTISYQENVKDLWEDIKERFSIGNGPRIQQIKSELAECRQTKMTMVAYYGKLKTLWDELANYQQIPICTCGECKCDIGKKLEKQREEEKVHQFLMGLDDALYGSVRSNLLATDPLPNLNRVYSTLVQEERVRSISRGKEERDVVGFAIQARARGARGLAEPKDKYTDTPCSSCNRTGHDADNCFELIGYPEWWGDRPRREEKHGARGRGRQRGGAIHSRGRNGGFRANDVHVTGESSTSTNDANKNALTGLSAEQWQMLVDLVSSQKGSVSDKMTGCHVGLPDGKQELATKEGTVILHGGLKIENDRTSKMLIGAGERRDGLYFFKGIQSERAHKAGVVCQFNLWHQRMGHPSLRITKLISNKGDNGTEFTCLKKYFRENGILFQTSCPGTPQQNGRVERKHRHILNVARALRFQGSLPISFWGECVLAAGDKFASRSRKCVFVGYPYGQK
ncbi:hypothetical protein A2U01_0003969, partial [Trifolium medium]|nr:hypothetical protein [Trifolium medium]